MDPESLATTGHRWDVAISGLVVALLVFMPATFGAVEAWSQLIVVVGAAVLAGTVALRAALDRDFWPIATWSYVPLALFILLAALQLMPLPVGLVRWLSPATVATKQEMLGDMFEPMRLTTLSFYPLATVESLRLLLVGTTVFVTVASVVRSRRQIVGLLTAIFAIGCAEAVLALAQIATGADRIYWSIPTTGSGVVTSGSFVNYSHFCQFMNLSLGAGLALILVQLHEQRRGDSRGASWASPLARINWETHGWLLFGMMLSAIVVFTSMSRNGVVSLVVAAAIVGLMLFRRGSLSWRGWLLGAIPLGVLAGLLIFGFDEVYERLATLQHTRAYEGRWEMLAATLRAWRAFPIFGTGLGTHQFVFPMFDTAVTPVVAAHADNEYAQLLEEMGVAGAAFVGLFLAAIAVLTVRLAFRGRKWSSAVASGMIFALVAVAIHSATDFGQRVPAIFCLSAAMCGLVVATADIEARERRLQRGQIPQTRSISLRARRAVAATSLATLIILSGWAMRDAYAAYLGERCWALALALENRVRQDSAQATDQDYVDLIAASQCAFSSEPRNVDYGYWLNSYRWESLNRNVDSDAQPALPADALPLVARIADELAKVRGICPTFGPPYALEGQLRLYVLGDEDGEELIRRGARLAPYDPPTCLVAGELAARHGQFKEAEAFLTRAVALRPAYFREASEIYLFVLDRPDLARSLAGDDYTRLEELARICAASENHADLAPELRSAAEASLRRHAATDDATPRELAILASIDVRQRQFVSAIELYRRALNRDYRQLEWRLGLARALAETGQVDDAIHEVRICLRLRPRHPGAIRLMKELIDRVDHAQLKDG